MLAVRLPEQLDHRLSELAEQTHRSKRWKNALIWKINVVELCYNWYMKTKSLIDTNPYLRDASTRKGLVVRSVRTSCGVEGICAKKDGVISFNIPIRKDKKIYKTAN